MFTQKTKAKKLGNKCGAKVQYDGMVVGHDAETRKINNTKHEIERQDE